MKQEENLHSLFITIILILLGLISPSNGFDDSIRKSPNEMLYSVLTVIVSSVIVFLIWKAIEKLKKVSEIN